MDIKEGFVYFSGIDAIHTTSLFKEIFNTFTVEFWAKPQASQKIKSQRPNGTWGTSGQNYVIGPGYGGDENTSGMGVSVGINGIIVWEHSANYLPPLLVYETPISDWTNFTIVYKNKTPHLYINGKLVKIGITSRKKYVHPSGTVGALEPYGYYRGCLKDVRIWSITKTEEEITRDMYKQLSGHEKGLFAYWKLTDGIDVLLNKQLVTHERDGRHDSQTESDSSKYISKQEDDIIFCTSICANYIPKAMVLAKTIKKYHPQSKVIICLVEEDVDASAKECKYFDEVILAKKLNIENFYSFIFKHNALEASTAVKGHLFHYLLNSYHQYNKFVYLDPDIYVMNTFTELNLILNNHSIVLTPHMLIPEHKDSKVAIRGNEIQSLQKGVYNLGFLAISRRPNSDKFISWWKDRLLEYCYDDTPNGLFTDQKWVDLAPGFFDVYILKHEGYNVAPWNLSKRTIQCTESGEFLVNNEPLRFVHFSGFDSGANLSVTKMYVRDMTNPIYSIRNQYLEELKEMGQDNFCKIPWSYDYYQNKEKVERIAQINYRSNKKLQQKYNNPFKYSNKNFI